jgi:O-antigen/teichoic acid export membrane protein
MKRLPGRLVAALWNGIAGALPRVAVLLAGLYVARRFGTEAFARYSLALSTFAVAGGLLGSTMTTVASKFVPEFSGASGARKDEGFAAIALFALTLGTLAGGGLFLAAPLISRLFGVEPPVDGLLRASALAVSMTVIACGLVGLLIGSARFGTAAMAYLGGFALFGLGVVPLANQFGIAGVLLALGTLYLGAALVGLAVSGRKLTHDAAAHRVRERLPALFGFFLPTLIAAGLIAPVVWGANAIVARGPEPLENLAYFNAAYSWFAVVSFLPAVLAQVEFVRMSQAKARGDTAMLPRALRRFVMQNALVMLPVALIGAALAWLLVGVYRLEGLAAERTLMLMLAAAFVASLGNPAGLFLAVVDRIWLASGLNVAWGIITLALAWWLRDGGAQSVALAFLLGYAAHCIVATLIAQRLLARETEP